MENGKLHINSRVVTCEHYCDLSGEEINQGEKKALVSWSLRREGKEES